MIKSKKELNRTDFDEYYKMGVTKYLFRWVDYAKIRIIEKQFSKLPRFSKILDIGSGTGSLLSKLNTKFDVYAIDINLKLIKISKKKGLKSCLADLEKGLPFKDNTFDGIMIVDVIEHIKCPYLVMEEILRCLKEEGILLIFTPPYDSCTWIMAEKIHHILTCPNSDHISPFTQESLTFLLKNYFKFKEHKIGKVNFGLTLYGYGIGKTGGGHK